MYLLSLLAVILISVIMLLFSGDMQNSILAYIDLPTLLLMVVLVLPMLASAHLLKDFGNAFKMVLSKKKDFTILQIKRAIEAVELVMKTVVYGGAFITLFTFIIVLREIDEISALGPNLSVAVLSLVYAFAINVILAPLKSRLKVIMAEYMQE